MWKTESMWEQVEGSFIRNGVKNGELFRTGLSYSVLILLFKKCFSFIW